MRGRGSIDAITVMTDPRARRCDHLRRSV